MNEITKLTILYLIDVVQALAMMVLVIAFVRDVIRVHHGRVR